MRWLHILFKDRGSTFIVILNTFLEGKLFFFFMVRQNLLKKWKALFVVVNTTVLTC